MGTLSFYCPFLLMLLHVALGEVYLVQLKESVPIASPNSQIKVAARSTEDTLAANHDAILNSLINPRFRSSRPEKLYSYTETVNAFCAKLTPAQADQLSAHPEVLNVVQDSEVKLTTTSTKQFLNLSRIHDGAWFKSTGSNAVIGMIDTGITPEHPSFSDLGHGSIPTKFKGTCEAGANFTLSNCNRKIVGARSFYQGFLAANQWTEFPADFQDYISPRDYVGHGTHVASVAAGSTVNNVNIGGVNYGTSRGIAYMARLSIYKVFWGPLGRAFVSDVVAAIDQAAKDGVDVINFSFGGSPSYYRDDLMVQACLGSVFLGVICVSSAGNEGDNTFGKVRNDAPWMLTVGSSSIKDYSTGTVAPSITWFTSKGPNFASYYILKPDIVAPGEEVVGAYNKYYLDKTSAFVAYSGSSHATAHVSGAVALMKSRRPNWSPSWIFSSIITTGRTLNTKGEPIRDVDGNLATPFYMGGGQVRPNFAMMPGLVYSVSSQDYRRFQCTPSGGISTILVTCAGNEREIDLNIPSLSLYQLNGTITVTRTLTLIGNPARYTVKVTNPAGVNLQVSPTVMDFTFYKQTRSFTIRATKVIPFTDVTVDYRTELFTFGTIIWGDKHGHEVRMNVAVNAV